MNAELREHMAMVAELDRLRVENAELRKRVDWLSKPQPQHPMLNVAALAARNMTDQERWAYNGRMGLQNATVGIYVRGDDGFARLISGGRA